MNAVQKTDPLIYKGYAGAFASFFQTGDPNAHKLTGGNETGVPESRRTNNEFVIEADGFKYTSTKILAERCGFWLDVSEDVPI